MSVSQIQTQDFLVELGTEELPPKALASLWQSFFDGIVTGLDEAGFDLTTLSYPRLGDESNPQSPRKAFAAPRRLAVIVRGLPEKQEDQEETIYGPPANIAYDADGKLTKAAEGFAARAGATAADLKTAPDSDKKNAGKLMIQRTIKGKSTVELLPAIVQNSLDKLPIPKRMRWGASRVEFVRPVQWLVMLFGNDVVNGEVLGLKAGNTTRGHRFHAPGDIVINHPSEYEAKLREAFVMVEMRQRKQLIKEQVTAAGKKLGGEAIIDDDLLNEVTALNEWPVALAGSFDESFLRVPPEALVSSMKEHQKYFHVMKDGKLMPNFITIANIESKDPAQVISGNEKVIRPRLSDAAFFWDTDRKQPLASRFPKLENVVWVNGLGSVADKTRRISALATKIAGRLGADEALVQRAAHLCKNDLVSSMVGEFAEMQGLAGKYYAEHDGEPADVAAAMVEQYMPAFAGDALPATTTGTLIALADRLDSLVGLFGIGQIPTGSKDPFALRRASLGVLRILVEKEIDIDLGDLIDWALESGWSAELKADTKATLVEYMLDRFSAWYADEGIPAGVFQSVRALGITNALDINRRVQAVNKFLANPASRSLAEANKRVANILAKNSIDLNNFNEAVNSSVLVEPQEILLAEQLDLIGEKISPINKDLNFALEQLASLNDPINDFFENVMVMHENADIRHNRIVILAHLRSMFMAVADISLL